MHQGTSDVGFIPSKDKFRSRGGALMRGALAASVTSSAKWCRCACASEAGASAVSLTIQSTTRTPSISIEAISASENASRRTISRCHLCSAPIMWPIFFTKPLAPRLFFALRDKIMNVA
eukprot:825355-Pleurochrysis_carterae.AAC.2